MTSQIYPDFIFAPSLSTEKNSKTSMELLSMEHCGVLLLSVALLEPSSVKKVVIKCLSSDVIRNSIDQSVFLLQVQINNKTNLLFGGNCAETDSNGCRKVLANCCYCEILLDQLYCIKYVCQNKLLNQLGQVHPIAGQVRLQGVPAPR